MGLPAQPARPGGPPVLIGGNSDAALDRVVALGDGWLGADLGPAETAGVDLLVIDVMNLPHAPTAVERIVGLVGA